MKNTPVCILFLLILLASTARAATWYVKPSAEIPLRRGQGSGYKIIAVLGDGTPVTILSEQNNWARVRLESGKEGWILKRYLGREKPYNDQIADLRARNAALQETLTTTKQQLQDLTDLHQKTALELSASIAERDTVKAEYARLQQDTRDVVETKQALQQARAQLGQLKKRLAELELENTGLKKSSALMWFLTGSGVLLLGLIIGLITGKRNKRRRSTLL
jgi:SH3 domain protein